MPDDDLDPAANTQMFQAFVDRREVDEQEAKSRHSSAWKWALAALVALVIVAVLAWQFLGR